MSSFTITYSVNRKKLSEPVIPCPKCGVNLQIYHATKKNGKHDSYLAECHNGCKHYDGTQLGFIHYTIDDMVNGIQYFKDKHC